MYPLSSMSTLRVKHSPGHSCVYVIHFGKYVSDEAATEGGIPGGLEIASGLSAGWLITEIFRNRYARDKQRNGDPMGIQGSSLRISRQSPRYSIPSNASSAPACAGGVARRMRSSCRMAMSLSGVVPPLPTIAACPALTSTGITRGELSTAG